MLLGLRRAGAHGCRDPCEAQRSLGGAAAALCAARLATWVSPGTSPGTSCCRPTAAASSLPGRPV